MKSPLSWLLLALVVSSPLVRAADADWAEGEAIASRVQPPHFPDRRLSIAEFGARPDGKSDSLPAIRAAIAACAQEGGGHVVVPAGTYLVAGPIELKSRIDLHLDSGAVLRFGGAPADYLPVVTTRWEGVVIRNYAPLIRAENAEDIGLTGPGKIDGNARATFPHWRDKQNADQKRVYALGAAVAPLDQRTFGAGHYLRPSLVEPYQCQNVLIEGVTLVDSPFWVVHPVFCRGVLVRGITVDSLTINNDGCDPDSTEDVVIEGCHFHTGDDGIAIKAGRDQDAWHLGRATRNVLIRDCVFNTKINALCIGSEMSGGVHGVFMERCRVENASSALYFKANRDRGGEVSRVRVRDIRIDDAQGAAIRFETNYHSYAGGRASPRFDDFVIERVTCARADHYVLYVDGNPDLPVRNVRLSDVTVDSALRPAFVRYAAEFRLENVRINGRVQPPEPKLETADAKPLKLRE